MNENSMIAGWLMLPYEMNIDGEVTIDGKLYGSMKAALFWAIKPAAEAARALDKLVIDRHWKVQ